MWLMSISKTVVTWAEVRFESTMCSAVLRRIGDIGTISTLPPGDGAAAGAGLVAVGGAEGAAAGIAGRAGAAAGGVGGAGRAAGGVLAGGAGVAVTDAAGAIGGGVGRAGAGAAAGHAGAAGGGGAAAEGDSPGPRPSRWPRMSCLVTRPEMPVP